MTIRPWAFILCAACAASAPALRALPLPGGGSDGVFMDYLAYDMPNDRVWVPAGNTGSVDVIDAATAQVTRVEGFATAEVERRGKKRTVGPSSATAGDGVVYVGNRADSSVCAVDAKALKRLGCVKLDSSPDGLAYIASTKEVWVTTPRDTSITILDATAPAAPAVKTKVKLDGEPEGYAVDDARGRFYTNLEDKDKSLAIDLKTHAVVATWLPACGEDGPKGLAFDHGRAFLLVACPDHVEVLDAGHDGKMLSKLDTGAGVDNIDYDEARHRLHAGASQAATLTVAAVDEQGKLTSVAVIATARGARNGVVSSDGTTFLADGPEGKILVIPSVK